MLYSDEKAVNYCIRFVSRPTEGKILTRIWVIKPLYLWSYKSLQALRTPQIRTFLPRPEAACSCFMITRRALGVAI